MQPTPAQRAIGDIAPKLVELTDNVLFGDVWERPQLSKRDRSLVTVAALIRKQGRNPVLIGRLYSSIA
jgi:4-carboxymuconolactone decarboxylase